MGKARGVELTFASEFMASGPLSNRVSATEYTGACSGRVCGERGRQAGRRGGGAYRPVEHPRQRTRMFHTSAPMKLAAA
jgi:hypothetical protein